MSEESLVFSVLGLTVRGFHHNDDKWVPKGGQRLSCALRSGAIDVLKDDQSVGKVATEAPNKCKDWLKENGNIEAVVTGLPKKHPGKKGEEVPVLFVFRSIKNFRMIHFKDAITTGISKLKKKSLKVVDGDESEKMTFSDTDETQFEFSVRGMTMRGFHVYNEVRVPSIGDRILCSVSDDNSVEMVKDGQTIGNVETDGQELFRKFINANGVIHAVVNAKPKEHKSKGEEIPVIYHFSADDWTNRLQNIRNMIRKDIEKRSKKKKCLQFICSEESQNEAGPSCDMQSLDMADGSGENMAGPSSDMQSVEMADGSGKNMMESSVTEVINKSHPEGNMEIGAGEKVSYRNTSSEQAKNSNKGKTKERACESDKKLPKTELLKESPDTTKSTNSNDMSASGDQTHAEGKEQNFRVPKGTTPVKSLSVSSASPAKRKTPKSSRSSPLSPVSTNTILKYFSPKAPESTESLVGKDEDSNPAKKRLLQEDDKKGAFKRNKEGDELDNGNSGAKFNAISSDSKQFFGAFIDTHGHVETLLESEAKVKASLSVCKVFYPIIHGSATATGFRVGSKYVMTAAHVTNQFLEGIHFAQETYVVFNYKQDGIFKEEDKYFIKEVVYTDDETDIAVVELLDDPCGMPPHVTHFYRPIFNRGFYLIGHSQGNAMEANFVNIIINKDDQNNQQVLDQLQEKSKHHTDGTGYDLPPHNTVFNPCRFLFQCKFTKGASGSPGIVLIGGQVYVTTVLLCGYPCWYYDPEMTKYKNNWPDDQCVQQGANIMSVCEKMRATNPVLCQDIFGSIQQ